MMMIFAMTADPDPFNGLIHLFFTRMPPNSPIVSIFIVKKMGHFRKKPMLAKLSADKIIQTLA
jgi:hypothetical protein